MNQYEHFTSLPPEEEQTFVVYERRSVETSKKAMMVGLVSSGILGIITLIIVLSFDKPPSKMSEDDIGSFDSFDEDEAEAETRPSAVENKSEEPEPAAEDEGGDDSDEGDAEDSGDEE